MHLPCHPEQNHRRPFLRIVQRPWTTLQVDRLVVAVLVFVEESTAVLAFAFGKPTNGNSWSKKHNGNVYNANVTGQQRSDTSQYGLDGSK